MNTESRGTNRAMRALCNSVGLSLAAVALLALTISVPAFAGNLVVNGGFELTTNGPNYFIGYGLSELVGWNYNAAPYPNAAVYTFAGANVSGADQAGTYYPLYVRALALTTASSPARPGAISSRPTARPCIRDRFGRPSMDSLPAASTS